ncbi:MAG TPA: hypothetical protein VFZ65_08320 [Planctomycetota bacterium]|nr:hypothetical protein [Planctomycetota bacterium]
MPRCLLTLCLASFAPLAAQNIDTLGSTSNPATTGLAKANLFGVDTTTLVLEMEWYLDVPGADTLTYFVYRHHSRNGSATLEWTLPVNVAGGGGPAWYSTGPIALPLVAGNHYALGVEFNSTLTYYFSLGSPGAPVSFGNWQRGHTPANPLPPTLTLDGTDIAQYYQRITSVAVPAVVPAGMGCSSTALVPRLVASGLFQVNTTTQLEFVDTAPNSIVLFAAANGLTVTTPLPLFGCSIWLDLTGPLVAQAAISSPAGYSNLPVAVPNNLALIGTAYSAQGLVFGTAIDVSNAVGFVVQ